MLYKFIMVKIKHKFLPKFVLNYITHRSVFYQNPLSILLFIVDILQFFRIDPPYLISL